jgi:ATP-dependent DNA ligase
MALPITPPLKPMLARLVRELPLGDFLYEPKWDGFRCLAFRDGQDVELWSRNDRPLARYFPELVVALRRLEAQQFVLDGEIVARDFDALLARLHPAASRVELLSRETPAELIAFDLLAAGSHDLRERPFRERRARLEELLRDAKSRVRVTEATDDSTAAEAWRDDPRIDGIVAKPLDQPYEEGRRAMIKVKRERTADCVVGGFRWLTDRPLPSSLLLGLYDANASLHHVGIAASFAESLRRELLEELAPLVVPLEGHPWEHGFLVEGSRMGKLKGAAQRWVPEMGQDWIPVAPVRVVEVAYDHLEGDRFRHPARFRRWRPDRNPESCRLGELLHVLAA